MLLGELCADLVGLLAIRAEPADQPLGLEHAKRTRQQERLDPHVLKPVTAESASLVWIVERTKWPVSAARRQISAVSWSRTSPTMMMSGSCRRNARSADENVSPTWP